MANDPRNLDLAKDELIVSAHANPRSGTTTVFFRMLERVAGIEGGTSASDYVISDVAGKKWLKFYAQTTHVNTASTAADQVSLLFCQLSQNSAVTWASICAKFILRVDTPSPGKNYMLTGLHAEAVVADTVEDPMGTICGAHFRVGREDSTLAYEVTKGTWYALKLSAQFGANIDTGLSNITAFIALDNDGAGANHMGWTLDLAGLTATADRAVQTHADDTDNKPTYYLHVNCPDANHGYIPIYPTHRATA